MTEVSLSKLTRQLAELETKMTAQVAQIRDELPTTTATCPVLATRLDRQAFVQIALLCKRALQQPPFDDLHRMYLLDIARECKRALEREG